MVEPHPSEEHELVLSSASRRILDATGRAVGAVPRILPGSLEERDALARIDEQRLLERPVDDAATRRRLRRHWSTRMRSEA